MGTIKHAAVKAMKNGRTSGELDVTMDWIMPTGVKVLQQDEKIIINKLCWRSGRHGLILKKLSARSDGRTGSQPVLPTGAPRAGQVGNLSYHFSKADMP